MPNETPSGRTADRILLIIDDDLAFHKVILHSLKKVGYTRVHIAQNAEEGLNATLREKPDVVIIDRVLGMDDGLDVSKAIRANPAISKSVKTV